MNILNVTELYIESFDVDAERRKRLACDARRPFHCTSTRLNVCTATVFSSTKGSRHISNWKRQRYQFRRPKLALGTVLLHDKHQDANNLGERTGCDRAANQQLRPITGPFFCILFYCRRGKSAIKSMLENKSNNLRKHWGWFWFDCVTTGTRPRIFK